LLIASTIGLSWLVMMAVHEFGHVLNAWLSGGGVQQVVLHPLAISRTDVSPNPRPLFVASGGAIWGVAVPLALLAVAGAVDWRHRYLIAFFAGFCCLANGLYLAAGSITGAGDAGDLLKHGAAQWQLVAFGTPLSILGLSLWHGLGPAFGLGSARGEVDRRVSTVVAIAWVAVTVVLALGSAC
jgi:hypothetical protein